MKNLKLLINTILKKIMTKEVFLYILFGVFTTLINIATFFVLNTCLHYNDKLSNTISISIAIIFAYITNRKWVFNSKASSPKEIILEMCKFFPSRLLTMPIEIYGCSFLTDVVHIPIMISKCTSTIIVIILNFFLSKFFAFRKSKI